jgi:hypothetical protein
MKTWGNLSHSAYAATGAPQLRAAAGCLRAGSAQAQPTRLQLHAADLHAWAWRGAASGVASFVAAVLTEIYL